MTLLKATKAGTRFNHVGARAVVTEVCRALKLKAQQARILMSMDPAGRADVTASAAGSRPSACGLWRPLRRCRGVLGRRTTTPATSRLSQAVDNICADTILGLFTRKGLASG